MNPAVALCMGLLTGSLCLFFWSVAKSLETIAQAIKKWSEMQ